MAEAVRAAVSRGEYASSSEMRSLCLTDQAEDDLAETWAFIAADNPQAANGFVHKLRERFEPLLSSQPRIEGGDDSIFAMKSTRTSSTAGISDRNVRCASISLLPTGAAPKGSSRSSGSSSKTGGEISFDHCVASMIATTSSISIIQTGATTATIRPPPCGWVANGEIVRKYVRKGKGTNHALCCLTIRLPANSSVPYYLQI